MYMSSLPQMQAQLQFTLKIAKTASTGGTADASGHIDLEDSTNWTTLGTAWSHSFKSRGGREYYLFREIQADVSCIVDFQYDSITRQLGPTCKLVSGSRTLEIVAAYDLDNAHCLIRCECREAA